MFRPALSMLRETTVAPGEIGKLASTSPAADRVREAADVRVGWALGELQAVSANAATRKAARASMRGRSMPFLSGPDLSSSSETEAMGLVLGCRRAVTDPGHAAAKS